VQNERQKKKRSQRLLFEFNEPSERESPVVLEQVLQERVASHALNVREVQHFARLKRLSGALLIHFFRRHRTTLDLRLNLGLNRGNGYQYQHQHFHKYDSRFAKFVW
jgi:hypothetical protein